MARRFDVPVNFAKNEIQNARVQNLSTAPSSPVTGQIYYDSDDNQLYFWNGSTWVGAASTSFGTPALTFGTSNAAGSATTALRTDAALAVFDATNPTTLSFGGSAATGSAAVAARRDHEHGMPAHNTAAHQELISTDDLTDWPRSASLSLNSQKITNLAEPTAATDAATKGYVDGKAQGLDFKESVRAATTGNITLSGAQTIDGVSVVAGDRVLVKDQTTASENGIYVAAAGAWARAADADSSAEVTPGLYTFVEEGTANGNSSWTLTTDAPITLGTTALTFAVFARAGDIVAGAGLTRTGQTLDVGAGTGISVGADAVSVDTTVVARKYTATIGDGSATSYTVTHSLGNQYVTVQTFDASSNLQVEADVTLASANTVTVAFAVAPATNAIRVVVVG